jgi:hypothetical protein
MPYGMPFSAGWVLVGLYLVRLRSCWLVSVPGGGGGGQCKECGGLEDDSFVSYVVYLEET